MIRAYRTLFALLLILSCACLRSADQNGSALILDETSFCRSYVEFGMDKIDPHLLKTEGENVLKQDARSSLGRLKQKVQRYYRGMGKPFDQKTWMDNAIIAFGGLQYASRDGIDPYAYTSPPPSDWIKTDFDDSGWVAQRYPLMIARRQAAGRGSTHGHRKGFFRFHFQVPDPSKAGNLTLDMTYRGGTRVFINGKEIARGHLPEGELKADTPGTSYPLEAYVVFKKDGSIDICTDRHRRGRLRFMGDVIGSFDKAPKYNPGKRVKLKEDLRLTWGDNRRAFKINRATWDRFLKLRNRHLQQVTIPKNLLKKGDNVLAIEIRTSWLHPAGAAWETMAIRPCEAFDHGHLLELSLRDPSGTIPSIGKRPTGVQVWAEDMHRRIIDREYHDKSGTGTVRFVGARNGIFTAQIVIATDKDLSDIKVTASDLKPASGKNGQGSIPQAALDVAFLKPHPLSNLVYLGCGRGGADDTRDPLRAGEANAALQRHLPASLDYAKLSREEKTKHVKTIQYFDHVQKSAPKAIPAGRCQPVWLTLSVPADATPGTYKGSVQVAANGMDPVTVPVTAEVSGWRVPDAKDSQVFMAMEQSPYGVAREYKVPLWSEKHFALIEKSMQAMGRIGNDFLFVPVVQNTEFGNQEDSMIGWIRKTDCSFGFDFKNLDRYLQLAVKHWGRPECICFVVQQGAKGNPSFVKILDEKTGKPGTLDLNSSSPDYRNAWKAFALSLHAHMKTLGLVNAMHWGYAWDDESDPNLPNLLAQFTPDVDWASGGHGHTSGGGKPYYTIKSFIYKLAVISARSRMGWKIPGTLLVNPRGGGNVA